MSRKPRIGITQMTSTEDVDANFAQMDTVVRDAVRQGAELVALPENFAYLGPEAQKVELSEIVSDDADGPILTRLRGLATEHSVVVVGGGMPEVSEHPGRAHNTCVVVGPDGKLIATYRKIHLFDVELAVSGSSGMRESKTVAPGRDPVVAELDWGPVGLSICYDLRFPELYRQLASAGAVALLVPSAFTLQTGKDHWEVLLRARAIENLCWVAAPAQSGRHSSKRSSWGKAMIVDPWGVVRANLGDQLGAAVCDLDLDYLEKVRRGLPALGHRTL